MTDLLPCPFCGEQRIFLNEPVGREKGSVNCPACLVVMPGEIRGPKGREELIGCWNARAAIAAMPGWQPDDVDLREIVLQVILATEGDTKRLNEAVHVVAATLGLPTPPEVQS